MAETYDFIIVGAGTSGSVIASRLANTASKPKVLLLEGGGPNDNLELRSPELRASLAFIEPSVNWGYISVPQHQLSGQEIPCARGKGLGGSSAISFSCWLLGDKEDFNEWADVTGDVCWKWEGEGGVMERLRKIEHVHFTPTPRQAEYVSQEALDQHSKTGAVDVSYDQHWHELEFLTFEAGKELGLPIKADINSGDPRGLGLSPSCYYRGLRTTAATTYLSLRPPNLTVLTDSIVSKIIFDRRKATGVQTLSKGSYHATKEVIVCAGTFDSARLLLLSGVGPSDELSALSIPVVSHVPGVGKNMKDHAMTSITLLAKPFATDPGPAINPSLRVGPQSVMAWLPSESVYVSSEFAALDEKTKAHLLKVPSFELMTSALPTSVMHLGYTADTPVITFLAALMNPQSSGSVRLTSADPSVPALIDPAYMSHPYDRRVAIEALRKAMEFSRAPTFAALTKKVIQGPASDSDDDIWEYWQKNVSPVWHFAGSCKMGLAEDKAAVVDTNFKVTGVEALRVADMSIVPVLPNCHTLSTAYLVGETAAEKLIKEYQL